MTRPGASSVSGQESRPGPTFEMVDSRRLSDLTEVCGLRVTGRLSPVGRTADGISDLVMEAGPVGHAGDRNIFDGFEANRQGITVRPRGSGLFVRFNGLGDAAIDLGSRMATVELSATSPPGMDEVLAAGPVLALALALRGQPCLHASAVSLRGEAVAFTAPSGGGKSTLAALACVAGAELVADDTLALAVSGSEVWCLPGSRELRLRSSTAELLAAEAWPRRPTADTRVAVLVGGEEMTPPRLAAIVLPMVAADGETATERLERAEATRVLLACARVVSLQTAEHARTMFGLAATLGASVPVYRVTMPALTRPVLPQSIRTLLEEHLGRPL